MQRTITSDDLLAAIAFDSLTVSQIRQVAIKPTTAVAISAMTDIPWQERLRCVCRLLSVGPHANVSALLRWVSAETGDACPNLSAVLAGALALEVALASDKPIEASIRALAEIHDAEIRSEMVF